VHNLDARQLGEPALGRLQPAVHRLMRAEGLPAHPGPLPGGTGYVAGTVSGWGMYFASHSA
jgi:hypothetical protein